MSIAMLSVTATQLLRLRDLARSPDSAQRPAAEVVDPIFITAVSCWRFGEPRPDMATLDFRMAVAKLGGHLNRKHDSLPGWLVLWRGWTELQLLVEAVQTLRVARCV